MNVIIRNEVQDEQFVVEKMTRDAFWDVYKPGCDEHLMVHQLHQSDDFIPELDFVAEYEGKIVGNVVCSYCKVVNETDHIQKDKDIIAIGPIGVIPEYQKQGIGGLLIEAVKEKCKEMGIAGIVLYGHPEYYSRFGFINAKEYNICTPQGENFDAFMALEVTSRSLRNITGRCYESKAFEIDKNTLEEFEKKFINIRKVTDNKKQYLDLLLLADEQEDMIDKYLEQGEMFVLDSYGVKAECVIVKETDGVYELKNIAVQPDYQRKGYGKYLIEYLVSNYQDCKVLYVGTGDCPSSLSFYHSCGFSESHRVENFFVDNYDHLMFEDGIQLVDMVYLKREC